MQKLVIIISYVPLQCLQKQVFKVNLRHVDELALV